MIRVSALIVLLMPLISGAATSDTFFELGRDRFERGDYQVAIEYLEHSVKLDPDQSEYFLWLGKAYGRWAEKLPWYKAVTYAEKSGESLKKAVDLDGRNIPALRALALFYEQAPGFLGGSNHKATEMKARIKALQNQ